MKNPRWSKKIDYDYDNDNEKEPFTDRVFFWVGAVGYRPAFGRNIVPGTKLRQKKGAYHAPLLESGFSAACWFALRKVGRISFDHHSLFGAGLSS